VCDPQHAASLTVGAAAAEAPGLKRSTSASRLAAAALLQAAARRERRNSFSEIYSWEGLQVITRDTCYLGTGAWLSTLPPELKKNKSQWDIALASYCWVAASSVAADVRTSAIHFAHLALACSTIVLAAGTSNAITCHARQFISPYSTRCLAAPAMLVTVGCHDCRRIPAQLTRIAMGSCPRTAAQ
jgi:hypothetical protein